jgi:DNA (cytosine-5)-methyltransferase 1
MFIAEHVVSPSLTASNDPSRSPQSAEITQQVTAIHQATMAVRRLTPLECERLMGWPDDWTAGQSDTHRYKQCGNGVASPVAQWIAEQLLKL